MSKGHNQRYKLYGEFIRISHSITDNHKNKWKIAIIKVSFSSLVYHLIYTLNFTG